MSATRTRTAVIGVGVLAVLAVGLGTWVAVDGASAGAPATTQEHRKRATAPVVKGDLTDSKVFAGALGHGEATGVPGAASGTITWLPEPGQVIGRDQPLYAVDERAVRALYGTTPLWRPLEYGNRGADVRQLNENLAALGYDVTVDEVFGKRTLAGVKRWQRDRGLAVTGTVTANDVVFVAGEVRIDSVEARLGQAAGGDVVRVTSTQRVVRTTVPQADAERVSVGTKVRLRINGGAGPVEGEVVDAAPGKSPDGAAVVDATISFDPGDRDLPATASVQVEAAGQTAHDVLSVPVQALVAGSDEGRYSVEVVRHDGATEQVPVEVGLVADGRAAVTGSLREGDEVVVPS